MKMLERESTDPFLLYGVAMEHKNAGRLDEALVFLARTLSADSHYCYAYYQRGQVEEQRGNIAAAKQAYAEGIAMAVKVGDAHAKSELEAALMVL